MIEIKATVSVNKSVSEICNFILTLDKARYQQWHPDHRDFKAIRRTPEIVGSVLYFEEKIGDLHLKYDWEIEEYLPLQKFVLKAKFAIPIYLILEFSPETANQTNVTQEIKIGYTNISQKLLDPIIKLGYVNDTQRSQIQEHFREEFKNLEKIL